MKVAILLCVMCVVVGTFAQVPGRTGGAASTGGGSSDAMRAMMMSRMLSGRGGAGGRNIANLLLLRGGLEPMEFLMCRQNVMLCMMFMN